MDWSVEGRAMEEQERQTYRIAALGEGALLCTHQLYDMVAREVSRYHTEKGCWLLHHNPNRICYSGTRM